MKSGFCIRLLQLAASCLWSASLAAQTPLPNDEALSHMYPGYQAATGLAEWNPSWNCDAGKKDDTRPCFQRYKLVEIATLLMARVTETDGEKIFVVTSATPHEQGSAFDCHACAPAIGVAVFAWLKDHWELKSSNPAIGVFGGWGEAGAVSLEAIGYSRFAVLLSNANEGQGYSSSYKMLLVPWKSDVVVSWRIEDEQDDRGAYNPDDPTGNHVLYRSSAAFRFQPAANLQPPSEYDDIEVISRGTGGAAHNKLTNEDWTEIYRFVDGTYQLLRHTAFRETKKVALKSPTNAR